jgi:NAD-dependent dihydropyrimidine dehydrogenase PreA subunit
MVKYKIVASKISEPVISETISKTGAQFYISNAILGEWGKELHVEIIGTDQQVEEALRNLERRGAKVSRFEEKVRKDEDLCVDCGACVTICPWKVIQIEGDWTINLVSEKCPPGCSLCVNCCPVRALRAEEVEA